MLRVRGGVHGEVLTARRFGSVSAALTLLGMHAFLLGVALDWRADYLKAISGFSILWLMNTIGAAAAIKAGREQR